MAPQPEESPFQEQATTTLAALSDALAQWHEAWQADSGSGYSDTEQALLETDGLLSDVETAHERWSSLEPTPEYSGLHANVTDALGDLMTRLQELVAALDGQDFERLRMVSQAVELSVQRLNELRRAAAEGARSRAS